MQVKYNVVFNDLWPTEKRSSLQIWLLDWK